MTPAGLAAIDVAKANGSWTSYDAIAELAVPDDLAEALKGNPAAEQHWQGFARRSERISGSRPRRPERQTHRARWSSQYRGFG
jgi:uncharacterized protein YdeI (YjbR/CyaY-like superfamily)